MTEEHVLQDQDLGLPVGRKSRVHDVLLGLAALVGMAVVMAIGLLARPVNDDYWAFSTQDLNGFWGSLVWYYTEFQGNVTSWFFILLHEQQWYAALTPLAAIGSVLGFFILLGLACWGGLTFLGVDVGKGWRKIARLIIGSLVVWLSLESVVGPNSTTAFYYMPSTIVHIWPWLFGLIALGLIFRERAIRGSMPLAVSSGFLAGSLGLIEAAVIFLATVIMLVWVRRWNEAPVQRRPSIGWIFGISFGFAIQVLSPATWARGGGIGSDTALTTNVQAVERLLAMSNSVGGERFSQLLLDLAGVDVWARGLVPVAVVGDLFLRIGLLAVIGVVAWWMTREVTLCVSRSELRKRMAVGMLVVISGGIAYSVSGALYAYAGRHAAGLALIVTMLSAGWAVYHRERWQRHRSGVLVGFILSLILLAGLAGQQLWVGLMRAQAWDESLLTNRVLVAEGRLSELVSVGYRAGASSSGLRDHDGGAAYIEWVRRIGG